MRRRDFLQILLGSAAASYIDYEKLLWIPGEKTIFIPAAQPTFRFLTMQEIVALELERVAPHLRTMFERDDMFYKHITNREVSGIRNRGIRFPLTIRPGK